MKNIVALASRGLVAALLVAAVAGSAGAQAKPVTLAVEGRSSANPSIAAQGQFVAVAWSAATTMAMDIYAATSRDGGTTFSAPVRVNATPGEARVSGEQPPRVALVPAKHGVPEVVVVWTAKIGSNTRILTAVPNDAGRTFGASKTVPGSEGNGSRGWESVSVGSNGRVFVLWLDHREAAMPAAMHHQMADTPPPATASAAPAPKADPTEKAALSKLYFSALDGTAAVQITPSVCYCCKTSVIADGSNIFAVWRHVYPGSQRDIAFSVSRDAGRTFSSPVHVSDDGWHIDGCPENGPAIAVDGAHGAHVVWPTPLDGKDPSQLALFYAVTKDGRTFSARTQIPSRLPSSHAQMVMEADGASLVAWDEIADGARRVAMARVRDGKGKPTITPVQPPENAAGNWYPVLATTSTGTVAAWARQSDAGSSIGVGRVK